MTVLVWFTAALCCVRLPVAAAQAFDARNPAGSGYIPTFADDFRTIKQSIWENDWWYNVYKETACQKHFLPVTTTGSPEGLTLRIGSLEKVQACAGVARYSSAHLDTHGKFVQKYGYFEASIKSPPRRGTLTAFWLLPESGAWPPEVDVEEIRGDVPKATYMTNHTGRDNRSKQFIFAAPESLSDTYHIYGVLLTEKTISWFIDGVGRGETDRGSDEATPMFVVFSLYSGKCGDGWAGCPPKATGWSAEAVVQWVRAWRPPGT